ncbi:MAG: NAD-dependent epimerase/dehydratase family protein [Deltaproteobacteria bacterium]|nr:NAD-dependent epimerase/dehydratase family protein [Deltaproteobacteria bacterium]
MILCAVLVTGANGFLGAEVVRKLLGAGISVRGTGIEAMSLRADIEYLRADITQSKQINPVLEGISTVIHVAGLAHIFSPDANSVEKFRQINEIGTANVTSAASAAGVRHLILISSVSVYGPYTQGMYDENTPCKPVGPYALSKYNAEQRAEEIAQKSGMALTILRLATLYGEGDPGNVGRLMRTLDNGRFLWIGDGSNRKSLLYKGDAARTCMAVAERPASGINIYNVSAPACTMHEIVDGIADALGKHLFPVRVPATLALLLSRHLSRIPNPRMAGLHQTVKKWLAEDVYDTHRFEEAYGFQTKTSLENGLKREVDWYRRNKSDD